MDGALVVLTHVLVGVAFGWLLVNAVLNFRRRERVRALAEADPARRRRMYRRLALLPWAVAALSPLIALISVDLSAADLGWAWPRFDQSDLINVAAWAYAPAWVVGSVLGALGWRLRLRRGAVMPRRPDAPLLPRTSPERRVAVAIAVTGAITEEVVFRGLLVGVGVHLYHLPVLVAAVGSLILYVAAHASMGWRGMIGAGFRGTILTIAYIATGSLVLGAVAYLGVNLVSLFLFPTGTPPSPARAAESTAPRADESAAAPVPPEPAPVPEPPAVTTLTVRSVTPNDGDG
jgi:membrane protease YdiL (CAAX protease family)